MSEQVFETCKSRIVHGKLYFDRVARHPREFTALAFTERLQQAGVQISMDGRGHCLDNIFVERLWRTVKYEDIYLQGYATVAELERGLWSYLRFYNEERLHQSLDYQPPLLVYQGTGKAWA